MITIRQERPSDIAAREALLDAGLGPARFLKTAERLREGRMPADGLSFVATDHGQVVGTLRLWHIAAESGQRALLLGPLAVAASHRNCGIGSDLVQHALRAAGRLGHKAVLLMGDPPYYGRFGFSAEKASALRLPGPYERHRLLALELAPDALAGAHGLVEARGRDRRGMKELPRRRAA
jgi:predicted N-acetyltransferase YhbS